MRIHVRLFKRLSSNQRTNLFKAAAKQNQIRKGLK